MNAINFTELRNNLKACLDRVYNDNEPLIVTRKNNENIVLLSVDDYNALVETNYLLSNPANVRHLAQSLEQARQGKAFPGDLDGE